MAFSLWGGWREVATSIARVGFFGVALMLTFSLANFSLRFIRWQKFLALLGHRVYWQDSLRIYIAGFGLTVLPVKAGETIRSVFLKQRGVSYSESLAAYFSEHLSNLMSMLLLIVIDLWAYPQAKPFVAILAMMISAILIIIQQQKWLQVFESVADKRLPAKVGKLVVHGIEIFFAFRSLFSFASVTLWSCAGVYCMGGRSGVLLRCALPRE